MKSPHLTTITGIMLLASSCCNVKEGNLGFSQAQKQMTPYKKNRTCRFTDNKGAAINFTVVEKKKDWRRADVAEGAMCGDYVLIEQSFITLSSKSGDWKIDLYAEMNWTYNDSWILEWDRTCTQRISFWRSIDQNFKNFRFRCDRDGRFAIDNTSTFLHENMAIGGRTYDNVVENRSGEDVLFYNKAYGVLKLVENGKDILTINR